MGKPDPFLVREATGDEDAQCMDILRDENGNAVLMEWTQEMQERYPEPDPNVHGFGFLTWADDDDTFRERPEKF